jgi:glycosyltransferase involved in cell wall biosynthesis
MKLLISAVACDPFGGSEGIYGWYVISALAKKHACHVITAESCRPHIEEAAAQGLVPDSLTFRYLGSNTPWHPNRLIARLQSWQRYMAFSNSVLEMARAWHAEVGFDVAQLVTYTTWRVPSTLWQLGIPLIWGPISGTEVFPRSCLGSLSLQARLFELLRAVQTQLARHSPAVRACAREAFRIPVPHQQAVEFLAKLRGSRDGVELCHNFFFPESRMDALHTQRAAVNTQGPLRAFGAGNLEGRKGVAIALEGIALAKRKGVRVEYHVTSRGPELEHLKRLAVKLGLADQVILGERFAASDFTAALATFDVCLLPSLRDGAGLSIMEAMLAGCVPIVADWCGPAEFVTEDCGFKVPVTNPHEMAVQICDILCDLNENRTKTRAMGIAARERIRSSYNEAQFLDSMNRIYFAALDVAR